MHATAQASLFCDNESEIDIASRICDDVRSGKIPHAVTHLRVRQVGPGWVVHGFCPATDPLVIHGDACDSSGVWFQLHPKAIGEVDPPTTVTAARFTILVRDEPVA